MLPIKAIGPLTGSLQSNRKRVFCDGTHKQDKQTDGQTDITTSKLHRLGANSVTKKSKKVSWRFTFQTPPLAQQRTAFILLKIHINIYTSVYIYIIWHLFHHNITYHSVKLKMTIIERHGTLENTLQK